MQKTFDCVEMKREIQERLLTELKGLSPEEQIRDLLADGARDRAEAGLEAWLRVRDPSAGFRVGEVEPNNCDARRC